MASPQKSVIVTGGASGIGLAMSRHFASQGHQVALLDVNSDAGQKEAEKLAVEYPAAAVRFKKCDVASWDELAAVFKEVFSEHGGRLDIVMANAGIAEGGGVTVVDLDEEEPSPPRLKTLDINLIGVIYSVKLAAHYMNKKPVDEGAASRGSIICTASNAGLYPFPISPLYSTTKFGVIGLVRALGPRLEDSKIQINALAPSLLETNIAGPDHSLFKYMIVTPMETLIRGVANFISDPAATGQVAEIHGTSVTIRPPHEYIDKDSKTAIDQISAFAERARAQQAGRG